MHQDSVVGALVALLLLVCLASRRARRVRQQQRSSSQDAASLLKETFSGSHKIDSGNINLALTINPTGSSTLSGPIKLSFGGPFQSRAAAASSRSRTSTSASAPQGKSGSLGIISTGSKGYVTLQGTGYQLPADDVPEARVELLGRRRQRQLVEELGRRCQARDQAAGLAAEPDGRR